MHNLVSYIKKLLPQLWKQKILWWASRGCVRGKGGYIHSTVQMLGASNIKIGENTCVSEYTWLNVNHRTEHEIAIAIGNNVFIGRRNFFSSGKQITLGDYVITTVDCKFICSSHLINNPLIPYLTSGTTSDDVIRIGVNCFLGAGSVVLGNVSIGHGSVIGAGAMVTKNIPPFSLVIGNPAKVSRRFSFLKNIWVDAENISDADLIDLPNENEYLKLLNELQNPVHMPVIAAGADLGNI